MIDRDGFSLSNRVSMFYKIVNVPKVRQTQKPKKNSSVYALKESKDTMYDLHVFKRTTN